MTMNYLIVSSFLSNLNLAVKKYAMKKQHLPSKICITCGRPFNWRKKWARDWEHVKYCSEKCKRNKQDESN